jgi:predicted enzyme related to lactoylglutathione lyase
MYPVMHFEMPATETRRAREFYERVFGWQTQPLGPEAGHFVLAFTTESDEHRVPKQRGAINGGFFPRTAPDQQIRLTILVDDIREAMRQSAAAGGTVLGGSQKPGQ